MVRVSNLVEMPIIFSWLLSLVRICDRIGFKNLKIGAFSIYSIFFLYFAIAKRSITALNNTYYLIPSELAGDTRELEMATIQHNELRTRNASFHVFARAKLSPSP
jgi:hypothetical protein